VPKENGWANQRANSFHFLGIMIEFLGNGNDLFRQFAWKTEVVAQERGKRSTSSTLHNARLGFMNS
jgi:hypothetical protein